MQSDGYCAYGAFARERGDALTLAGCWAHARRGFHEALPSAPRDAVLILQAIGNLYRIEARLRARRTGPKLRALTRRIESRPVIERLGATLRRWSQRHRHLPQSAMGQAIEYALGQWPALSVYLGDGRVEIDNNPVENAIRPTAIGKKNWLFIPSAALRAPAAERKPASAAPSSTPSSRTLRQAQGLAAAGGGRSTPPATCAPCSAPCPR